MQASTIQFVITALQADLTLTGKERQEIMARLTNKAEPHPHDRLLTRQEAAERLAVSCRSIDLLARAGRLRKVFLTGRKRGGRIPESSVAALIDGQRRINREGGVA
jgi:excisionase family DNA binding protein